MKVKLTYKQAQEILRYDPDSGSFFWRMDRGSRARAGARAGNLDPSGYVRIRTGGVLYHAHRLAWLFVFHSWPPGEIDHINGNRGDNRIRNLRKATRTQQCQNKSIQSNNSCGLKGVCWFKPHKKWKAEINVNGQKKHLGYFDDPVVAAQSYEAAARKYFGEFARLPS